MNKIIFFSSFAATSLNYDFIRITTALIYCSLHLKTPFMHKPKKTHVLSKSKLPTTIHIHHKSRDDLIYRLFQLYTAHLSLFVIKVINTFTYLNTHGHQHESHRHVLLKTDKRRFEIIVHNNAGEKVVYKNKRKKRLSVQFLFCATRC